MNIARYILLLNNINLLDSIIARVRILVRLTVSISSIVKVILEILKSPLFFQIKL